MATLTPPSSEGLGTPLARDWAVQVNTGTAASPDWKFILGLSKFAPKIEATMKDDSDINSGGYGSEIATELKLTVDADGLCKGDPTNGFAQDPGQAFLQSKGEQLGIDNVAQIRFWRVDDVDIAKEARFAVKWVPTSEGKDGLFGFSLTLSSRGKPVDIVKPANADSNTSPSTPVGGGVAG